MRAVDKWRPDITVTLALQGMELMLANVIATPQNVPGAPSITPRELIGGFVRAAGEMVLGGTDGGSHAEKEWRTFRSDAQRDADLVTQETFLRELQCLSLFGTTAGFAYAFDEAAAALLASVLDETMRSKLFRVAVRGLPRYEVYAQRRDYYIAAYENHRSMDPWAWVGHAFAAACDAAVDPAALGERAVASLVMIGLQQALASAIAAVGALRAHTLVAS